MYHPEKTTFLYYHCVHQKVLETFLIGNAPYRSFRKQKMCYNCKNNPRRRHQSRSLLAFVITKCSLCWRTHGIIEYVTGSCSGVQKGKLLQNLSKYGQLPTTAKQQLAIAILFKLKITYNNQT